MWLKNNEFDSQFNEVGLKIYFLDWNFEKLDWTFNELDRKFQKLDWKKWKVGLKV